MDKNPFEYSLVSSSITCIRYIKDLKQTISVCWEELYHCTKHM